MEQQTTLTAERDTALDAYLMVRGFLRHNELLIQGIQPTDSQGEPLYVNYKSDEVIRRTIENCYGLNPLTEAAVKKAYETHYKEMLNRRQS